mmetsp:Transcript_11197/g.33270  ORF Transcript_11197/g.33270 Transcript_11197/m.33270 type:complete len:221 (+) Transcript_11197:467-1129(+)
MASITTACTCKHALASTTTSIFFTLVFTTWLWALLVLIIDIIMSIPSTAQPFGEPLNTCAIGPSMPWYTPLLGVHALLSLLGFGTVSSLLTFHLMICWKKMTTYEWLLHDIAQKRDADPKSFGERAQECVQGVVTACKKLTARKPPAENYSTTRNAPNSPNNRDKDDLHDVQVTVVRDGPAAPVQSAAEPANKSSASAMRTANNGVAAPAVNDDAEEYQF